MNLFQNCEHLLLIVIMLKCQVCKCSYKEEVNICKQCNLSEENITRINEISPDNPILQICIPTLVKKLNKYKEIYHQDHLLSNIQKLDIKVRTIETEQKEVQQKVKDLEKTVIELKSQIQSKDNYHNINPDLQEDSNNTSSSKDLDYQTNNNSNKLLDKQESHFNNETEQDEFFQVIDTKTPQFVEIYNRDKNLFGGHIISTVIETLESNENRLSGRSEAIFFSSSSKGNKGNYWIVEENNNYYLVPHAKIKINEHNKRYTIENIFECNESSSGDYNFKLIQPAKVSTVNSESWQLEKKGKLEFF